MSWRMIECFFFFNDTATTEIYTLSLHDALPIYGLNDGEVARVLAAAHGSEEPQLLGAVEPSRGCILDLFHIHPLEHVEGARSEEHTSELQSRQYLVCRLLLEKKKYKYHYHLYFC